MNARWFRFLPSFVRTRLDGRHGLQAVLGNSGWMFADKILRMGIGLLVGIWVVRYLGPQQLGLLSYAGAFAGLFGALATLGLDSIVIRELVKNPSRQSELLGSAFVLKLVSGAITLLIVILAIWLIRPGENLTIWIVAISAASYLLLPVNVIDMYFQAKVQSKYTVCAAIFAFLLTTLAKIVMIVAGAPVIAFAWVSLAEAVLTSGFLVAAYGMNYQRMRDWRYEWRVARELLSQSWPLILSGLSIMLYMRLDQIMIGQMMGDRDVGLFAAAVRISEMWYFIPMALASSVFPTIVDSKKISEAIYYERLQKFFTIMVWLAIGTAVAVTLSSNLIVRLLYGAAYATSSTVLAIHIWAGIFVASGVASGSWFIVEHLQKFTFYRTLAGGVVNIALNLFLIPRHGIEGAAVATVVSQACAALFFDFFNSKTRPIFWMKIRAIFNPLAAFAIKKK
jgi:PST family polysaccharide transporter